jgi:MerR family mercuric resistance operon transcriptional regulator
MRNKPLTIGYLAKLAEVNVETIRFYEKSGLIQQPLKPEQGYRIYPEEILAQLFFIKKAKLIGFTLNEIQELLALDENNNCHEANQLAQQKLILVNEKLNDLQRIKKTLEIFVESCEENTSTDKCIIIQSLKSSL